MWTVLPVLPVNPFAPMRLPVLGPGIYRVRVYNIVTAMKYGRPVYYYVYSDPEKQRTCIVARCVRIRHVQMPDVDSGARFRR